MREKIESLFNAVATQAQEELREIKKGDSIPNATMEKITLAMQLANYLD